jgi:hypothetical protein
VVSPFLLTTEFAYNLYTTFVKNINKIQWSNYKLQYKKAICDPVKWMDLNGGTNTVPRPYHTEVTEVENFALVSLQL